VRVHLPPQSLAAAFFHFTFSIENVPFSFLVLRHWFRKSEIAREETRFQQQKSSIEASAQGADIETNRIAWGVLNVE